MSLLERTVLSVPKDILAEADGIFEKQSKMDLQNLNEAMEEPVWNIRRLCLDNIAPVGVFCSVPLERANDQEAQLATGHVLRGGMVPLLLTKAFEVILFAVTLKGFDRISPEDPDIMDRYLLDTWGTGFVERSAGWVERQFFNRLADRGLFFTNPWSPGQHGFPLENQAAIFDILKAEEIGLSLTERFMMHPTKSVSGVIGVMKEKDERNLFPCDFCPRKGTCPSAYSHGCVDL